MSTFREVVYMCIDELKLLSDDAYYTEEHILFLIDKYRSFILKQRYSDIKKQMPSSNYQTLDLELEISNTDNSIPTEYKQYLKSKEKIPFLMQIGTPRVYVDNDYDDYYKGEITYISRDRMRYTGYNKYTQNIIYCSISPDNYLFFKCYDKKKLIENNDLVFNKVKFTGIFQNSLQASSLSNEKDVDKLDRTFPLEDALIPTIVELIVKELSRNVYLPEDKKNNADDNLSDINMRNNDR